MTICYSIQMFLLQASSMAPQALMFFLLEVVQCYIWNYKQLKNTGKYFMRNRRFQVFRSQIYPMLHLTSPVDHVVVATGRLLIHSILFDWMVGYASGLASRESNQDPRFVGEVMSNNARASSLSAATQSLKPSYGILSGLGAAMPYFSSALKTVGKNFRCLRNAILDQIRHISRALGEDLLSPTTAREFLSRVELTFKVFEFESSSAILEFDSARSSMRVRILVGLTLGYLNPNSMAGVPRDDYRNVRYPTDTDKHMLAIQTGLSRNQVSNWFINSRVRFWKPMVEEIHMLESKGLAEGNLTEVEMSE
ncbi:hypothetical protein F3Y22_tig00003715pilonHSYRG00267 [Hibiscus syriacus]|uniref:Homeobox domain-containing protein n=1 Tax=Hibiscus syriacus TaxID=106335 RepID=A0A6A3CJF4_HIBSY|nr:hypothetical protein F3Y22_tig00003715pilonHSYRG00267 [Hibiscus syriacus]